MSPRLRIILAVACACVLAAAMGAVPSSLAASPARAALRVGSVPQLPSGASVLGALPGATRMQVAVALRPSNPTALEQFATGVSTPGSSLYHDYITPSQFATRFGATSSQIDVVEASLRAHGLSPGPAATNHLSIPVAATADQLQQAFSLSLVRVGLQSHATAILNRTAPLLDANVAGLVQGIVGLNTLSSPQPLAQRPELARPSVLRAGVTSPSAVRAHTTSHVATGGPQPCAAAASTAPGQSAYTVDQIASAYGFSDLYRAGDEGAGQTVAIYELEPYAASDISAYQACYGTHASVSNVSVDGGAGSGPGSGEAAFDIEQVIGLAPKANVLVYEGPNSNSGAPGSGPYDTWSRIISQDRARVITASWGQCEALEGAADANDENTLFQEAAAQGQTILSASGDSGSEDCGAFSLGVDDPSSQPFITGVGGTTLSSLGPRPSEQAWNNGGNILSALGLAPGAGGGGISTLWRMPSYQSDAPASLHVIQRNSSGAPCAAGSGRCRQSPDVAADADPNTGYLIYWNGSGTAPGQQPTGWQGIGGTSGAAPLWAAVIALANASTTCAGEQVGFANPALYRAAAADYGGDFNDVKSGNNDFTGTNGGLFPAGTGYDMTTGLGTPNASSLVSSLCAHATKVGSPSVSASSLSGVRSFRPKLRLMVSAGTDAPGLHSIAIHLPSGLRFARGHRGVSVLGPGGHRAAFNSSIGGSVLTIKLRTSNARVRITVSYATISATRHEAALARRGRAGKLPIGLTVTDSHGRVTRLTVTVNPNS